MNFPSRIHHYGRFVSRTRSLQLVASRRSFTMATTKTAPKGDPPRPSASLVIVNSQNEVLLVQRNPKATSFAGFHVFPGGNTDPEDNGSPALTAIRETFEESGLLLASSKDFTPSPPLSEEHISKAREAVLKKETTFNQFLADNSLVPDLNELLPFTQWITPLGVPRRFHAHFFVVFLQTAASSGDFTSGDKKQFLPTPDGGQEVISARFVHPNDAIASFRKKQITFMPPQYYILTTLADILHGQTNTQDQRDQVAKLARSPFGSMVINPRRLMPPPAGISEDEIVLTYEGDESRGGPPSRLHRAILKNDSKGMPLGIILHRNFDIFNDIKPVSSSKL